MPLITEFTKEIIRDRHWEGSMAICRVRFDFHSPGFKLQSILDMNLVKHRYEVEEVTDGAYKQLMIKRAITEIRSVGKPPHLHFVNGKVETYRSCRVMHVSWRSWGKAQMNLQGMLMMLHVTPFREVAQGLLTTLSVTGDTLERWIKVQIVDALS
jgi:dynein heavy chain